MHRPTHAVARIAHAAEDPLVRVAIWSGAVAIVVALVVTLNAAYLAALVGVAAAIYVAVSYEENESSSDLSAPLPQAWNAVIDSLGENGYTFGEPTWYGATEGRIRAGDARVVVERHPGGRTRVRIRVGLFDTPDHARRAGLVLESVEKRLAA